MLPERVLVKVSSEAAGSISVTPVIAEDLPFDALLDVLLGIAGKDAPRIRELLMRGVAVQGASRFRWTKIEAEVASIEAALAHFPDADPQRAFEAQRCFQVRLQGARNRMDVPREIGARRRLLSRRSFWSALMDVAVTAPPHYIEYSYRYKADSYRLELSSGQCAEIIEAAGLLRYSGMAEQVRRLDLCSLEFLVRR